MERSPLGAHRVHAHEQQPTADEVDGEGKRVLLATEEIVHVPADGTRGAASLLEGPRRECLAAAAAATTHIVCSKATTSTAIWLMLNKSTQVR